MDKSKREGALMDIICGFLIFLLNEVDGKGGPLLDKGGVREKSKRDGKRNLRNKKEKRIT